MSFGGVVPTRSLPPIEFELEGVPGFFRATPKPPLKVIEAVLSIAPDETGRRRYAAAMLLSSLEELVVERLWMPWSDDARPDPEGRWVEWAGDQPEDADPRGVWVAWTDEDRPDPEGRWVEVDDRKRLREVLYGDEYVVPIETIAAVVMGLVERTTGNPTGGPRP